MWKLRPRKARDLPDIAQEDRPEADPETLCVGSEVRLTPMWSMQGLISMVLGGGGWKSPGPLSSAPCGRGPRALSSSRGSWVKPGS